MIVTTYDFWDVWPLIAWKASHGIPINHYAAARMSLEERDKEGLKGGKSQHSVKGPRRIFGSFPPGRASVSGTLKQRGFYAIGSLQFAAHSSKGIEIKPDGDKSDESKAFAHLFGGSSSSEMRYDLTLHTHV
jgi:hypothetical protein